MNTFRLMKLKLPRRKEDTNSVEASAKRIFDANVSSDNIVDVAACTDKWTCDRSAPDSSHDKTAESFDAKSLSLSGKACSTTEQSCLRPANSSCTQATPPPSPNNGSTPDNVTITDLVAKLDCCCGNNEKNQVDHELLAKTACDDKCTTRDINPDAITEHPYASPETTDEEDAGQYPMQHHSKSTIAKGFLPASLTSNDTNKKGEFFKCSFCERAFSYLCHMKVHERIHTGEKPYPCKFCSTQFSQLGSLTVHMRIHTGEKPYQCRRCMKKFRHINSLRRHQRQVHANDKKGKSRATSGLPTHPFANMKTQCTTTVDMSAFGLQTQTAMGVGFHVHPSIFMTDTPILISEPCTKSATIRRPEASVDPDDGSYQLLWRATKHHAAKQHQERAATLHQSNHICKQTEVSLQAKRVTRKSSIFRSVIQLAGSQSEATERSHYQEQISMLHNDDPVPPQIASRHCNKFYGSRSFAQIISSLEQERTSTALLSARNDLNCNKECKSLQLLPELSIEEP